MRFSVWPATGGTVAELLETAKLASTRYLDSLPTVGSELGHGFRDRELEAEVLAQVQAGPHDVHATKWGEPLGDGKQVLPVALDAREVAPGGLQVVGRELAPGPEVRAPGRTSRGSGATPVADGSPWLARSAGRSPSVICRSRARVPYQQRQEVPVARGQVRPDPCGARHPEPTGIGGSGQPDRLEREVRSPFEQPSHDVLVLARVEGARAVHEPSARSDQQGGLRDEPALQVGVALDGPWAPRIPRSRRAPEHALARAGSVEDHGIG